MKNGKRGIVLEALALVGAASILVWAWRNRWAILAGSAVTAWLVYGPK